MAPGRVEAEEFEQLTDFVYLIPVGLIRFRLDGTIEMATPRVAQLLMPLMQPGDLENAYSCLGRLVPNLKEVLCAAPEKRGIVVDQARTTIAAGPCHLVFAVTIHRIDASIHIAVLEDVTVRADQERQLDQIKQDLLSRRHYDGLTGLANGRLASSELANLQAQTEPHAAMIFIDLCGLRGKTTEASGCFVASDALLVETARRVLSVARAGMLTARLRSQHFVCVCSAMPDDEVMAAAARIRAVLATPFDIEGQTYEVCAKVEPVFIEAP